MIGLGVAVIALITSGVIYLIQELANLFTSPVMWIALHVVVFTLLFYLVIRTVILIVVKLYQKFFDAVS